MGTGYHLGYALTGSFCTMTKSLDMMALLVEKGYEITPIFSYHAAQTDTRFGRAADFLQRAANISGKKPVITITDAEPLGPKIKLDLMVVAPCTANTAAKLANAIYDTPVTLAVKAHLRGERPVLLAVCTNDAFAASAANIGQLLNTKHIYLAPMVADDPVAKPASGVAEFPMLPAAIKAALNGRQLRPVFLTAPGTRV